METDEKKIEGAGDIAPPVGGASELKNQDSVSLGYFTVKEIAQVIGFHQDTVYEWISSKGMPVRRSGLRGRMTVYWPDFIKWWSSVKSLKG